MEMFYIETNSVSCISSISNVETWYIGKNKKVPLSFMVLYGLCDFKISL